ncbi:MAG: 50S ribosomal protein L16 [Acholeplasma sp.]|jgi:large subunit ribosomal protein L16|nr:50S ribosomal protein L16 [Acholeplasma sp.]CCY28068.1 50S ribosomal protein L16 [Acholeplasma sp. CAG:878]
MAVIPKRTKYRRTHRLPYEGNSRGNTELHFGEFGLQAQEGAWITQQQIEAARVAMTRYMKRGGKIWINIFPHQSLTKIPLETRMGKGKGQPEVWVAVVKKNKIMFEVAGVSEEVAREALRLAMHKLPIKCKFVKRGDNGEN